MRAPVLAALALCLAGTVAAGPWRALPGAPEMQLDVGSLQGDRQRASAWLKWWGVKPLAIASVPGLARARVHRSTAHVEFDCNRRTVRLLALNAWDAQGTPLLMSSVAGPELAVQGDSLDWAYDAVCESARSAGRTG